VTYYFGGSLDGTNFMTNWVILSLTANATTKVGLLTNIDAGSMGFLRLDAIGNANSADITNMLVQVGKKPIIYGP
jgi:hypothetical protein